MGVRTTFVGAKVSGIDRHEDATLYIQLPLTGGSKTTRALR
jgi:hypothetical protein